MTLQITFTIDALPSLLVPVPGVSANANSGVARLKEKANKKINNMFLNLDIILPTI
jgi:hypothetical protein